ncbi:MAG: methyltransferase [Planctomycetota bacterium]
MTDDLSFEDSYLHRRIALREGKRELDVCIANSLFSRAGLDVGSKHLLDSLIKQAPASGAAGAPASILDIGCGWGPIALRLAVRYPDARVVATDRDLLAVHTTAINAAINEIANLQTVLSLGYSGVRPGSTDALGEPLPDEYDLIVLNIPAKVGENGLRELLFGAGHMLRPNGTIAVVFVSALAQWMRTLLAELQEAGGVAVELRFEKVRAEHTVWHLCLPEGLPELFAPTVDLMPGITLSETSVLWPYLRQDLAQSADGMPAIAVHNVAEFDTLDYRNRLFDKTLHACFKAKPADEARGERMLVFNPRHGYLVRQLMLSRRPGETVVVDRDALALEATSANLTIEPLQGLQVRIVAGLALGAHDVWAQEPLAGPFNVIAGVLRDDEGRGGLQRLLLEAAQLLAPDGVLLLGMASAEVGTLLKPALKGTGMRLSRQFKRKGFVAQLLRPPRAAGDDSPDDEEVASEDGTDGDNGDE